MNGIRTNVIFNYVGQIYVGAATVIVLPMYLSELGAEAYGLVGFFILVQYWSQLLDLGMSPTLSREVAAMRGRETGAVNLRSLLRGLEAVFLLIATVVAAGMLAARTWIGSRWLNVDTLDIGLVEYGIAMTGLVVASRTCGSLYRSGVTGFERLVWLNIFNVIIATLRFPGSLVILKLTAADLYAFFTYQVGVSALELLTLGFKFYRLLPPSAPATTRDARTQLLRVLPFTAGIAYTSTIWVLVNQLDKLVLSGVLSLRDYGYFTLMVTVSAAISMLGRPVATAILPRMVALLSAGKENDMRGIYRRATRFIVAVVSPLCIVIFAFPEQVLFTWTGDSEASAWAARYLGLFVLASGILSAGAFPYHLQYAHGKIGLHVKFSMVSALVQLPVVIYAALHYGVGGVALTWLGFRTVAFLLWTPYVHRVFAPGLHLTWMLKDVARPLVGAGVTLLVLISVFPPPPQDDRIVSFMGLAGLTVCGAIVSLAVSFAGDLATRARRSSRPA